MTDIDRNLDYDSSTLDDWQLASYYQGYDVGASGVPGAANRNPYHYWLNIADYQAWERGWRRGRSDRGRLLVVWGGIVAALIASTWWW